MPTAAEDTRHHRRHHGQLVLNALALASCTQAETLARQADGAGRVQDLSFIVACACVLEALMSTISSALKTGFYHLLAPHMLLKTQDHVTKLL